MLVYIVNSDVDLRKKNVIGALVLGWKICVNLEVIHLLSKRYTFNVNILTKFQGVRTLNSYDIPIIGAH